MKAVLFDLDGTLWDTSEQVSIAWNKVFEDENLSRRIDIDELKGYMGRTIDDIAAAIFPDLIGEQKSKIMRKCLAAEEKYLAKSGGKLYPKLEDTLKILKKHYFLGIVSNCQDGYIQTFLQKHGLGCLFDGFECAGRTGLEKGDNIKKIMADYIIDEAVFVGDTQKDLDAADYARIPFIHASYGFGQLDRETDKIDCFELLAGKLTAKYYSEKAMDFFQQGYNCAQSVLMSFSDVTGISPELSARIASSFGGGMGRMREVCGTVSGMLMAAGIICGYSEPNDKTAKAEHYRLVQELAGRFKTENGSIVCRELLGLQKGENDSFVPSERTGDYYRKRPCKQLTGDAAGILGEYIAQNQK